MYCDMLINITVQFTSSFSQLFGHNELKKLSSALTLSKPGGDFLFWLHILYIETRVHIIRVI